MTRHRRSERRWVPRARRLREQGYGWAAIAFRLRQEGFDSDDWDEKITPTRVRYTLDPDWRLRERDRKRQERQQQRASGLPRRRESDRDCADCGKPLRPKTAVGARCGLCARHAAQHQQRAEREKRILLMCEVDGVPVARIARIEGTTRNAVYQTLHRARRARDKRIVDMAADGTPPRRIAEMEGLDIGAVRVLLARPADSGREVTRAA